MKSLVGVYHHDLNNNNVDVLSSKVTKTGFWNWVFQTSHKRAVGDSTKYKASWANQHQFRYVHRNKASCFYLVNNRCSRSRGSRLQTVTTLANCLPLKETIGDTRHSLYHKSSYLKRTVKRYCKGGCIQRCWRCVATRKVTSRRLPGTMASSCPTIPW